MKKIRLEKIDLDTLIRTRDFENALLSRDDLINLVKSEEMKSTVILGGDVVKLDANHEDYKYTYDGWNSKRNGPLESFEDYAARSREETLSYVSSYPNISGEIAFLMVMSRELTAGLLKL
jgi:Immunity protein 40